MFIFWFFYIYFNNIFDENLLKFYRHWIQLCFTFQPLKLFWMSTNWDCNTIQKDENITQRRKHLKSKIFQKESLLRTRNNKNE